MCVPTQVPIPRAALATLLGRIERGYLASNPFHNALHASDVMFTTHYFLQAPLLRDTTGPLDKFAAVLAGATHTPSAHRTPSVPSAPLKLRDTVRVAQILAAAAHDLGHPGLSNPFLIASRDATAITYNDQSVLEMFHIAGTFAIMLTEPGCDVTAHMTRGEFRQFRETMVSMVRARAGATTRAQCPQLRLHSGHTVHHHH